MHLYPLSPFTVCLSYKLVSIVTLLQKKLLCLMHHSHIVVVSLFLDAIGIKSGGLSSFLSFVW